MERRLEQLLGVTALAVLDRLRASEAVASVGGEIDASALVHLQAWPGGSVGDLREVVGRSQPATVRLVDRLVEQAFVRREEGRNRRTVALVLTSAGSKAASRVLSARAQALAPLLDRLSAQERGVLEGLLGRVTAGMAEGRAEAVRVCRLCDRHACAKGPGCPLDHTTESDSSRPAR